MKINVEESQCIGCGACAAVYEETFDINEQGISIVKSQENVDESMCDICPVGAITITKEDEEVAEAA